MCGYQADDDADLMESFAYWMEGVLLVGIFHRSSLSWVFPPGLGRVAGLK